MNVTEQLVVNNHNGQELDRDIRLAADTATWLAEMLYGSMRTSFDFTHDGSEIRSQDGGSMDDVFDDAIEDAKILAYTEPHLLFELRRRLIEREELNDMHAMFSGELYTKDGEQANTIVVLSDFPPELMEATEDVGGYNASRRQAMLRIITLNDGVMKVTTQSLDGSNRQALEAVGLAVGKESEEGELLGQRAILNVPSEWQQKLPDVLTDAYDESMAKQLGGSWHAGIRQPDARAYVNTYEFALQQRDLIDWFTSEMKRDPVKAEAESRYQVAATAKSRYERFIKGERPEIVLGTITPEVFVTAYSVGNAHASLAHELYREGQRAAAKGETFSGCGVTVSAQSSAAEVEAKELGYGNKIRFRGSSRSKEDCEFESKECPECHAKKVMTRVTKTHISGSCGCSKKREDI